MTTIKAKISAIYDSGKTEKISDAKVLRILSRIPTLMYFFKLFASGMPKMQADVKSVQYSALQIGHLVNAFIGERSAHRITKARQDADGVTVYHRVRTFISKPKFVFGRINMGSNRRVKSVMCDE